MPTELKSLLVGLAMLSTVIMLSVLLNELLNLPIWDVVMMPVVLTSAMFLPADWPDDGELPRA